MKKEFYRSALILLLATIILYVPILLNPAILLERGNDLREVFWPVFYFIRNQFWQNFQLPLWNNLFFAGTPLLPDPQFSYFYLLNYLFIAFPTSTAFIVYIFMHLYLAAVTMYLLLRYVFKFNWKASLFGAFLYIVTPRVTGYIEAGHITLIASYPWIPLAVLSILKLFKTNFKKWILITAISIAMIFFTHTLIFLTVYLVLTAIYFYVVFFSKQKKPKKIFIKNYLVLSLLTFGIIAVGLLPQLEWSKHTTRFLLIENPQVYPLWLSKIEYVFSLFLPWINGMSGIWQIDTEKWITIGSLPLLLSNYGFLKLKRQYKIPILFIVFAVCLLSLNNLLPFYPSILKINLLALLRVTTRIWFINNFIVSVLCAYAVHLLIKSKKRLYLINLLIFISISEVLIYSWIYMYKPIHKNPNLAPKAVYEYLSKDDDLFRVFCTNRCLSQYDAVIYGLELVEGYNTLQQTNYFKQSWQLMGGYWNYYTLTVPPVGINYEASIKPNAKALGLYNTKYIISPFTLSDPEFVLKTKIGKYHIYQNSAFQPRSNANIEVYKPNYIKLNTKGLNSNQVTLSEVYNSGWRAFLNGQEEVKVQETTDGLRAVDIKPDTNFVEIIYKPKSFQWGILISFLTVLLACYYFLYLRKLKE